MKKHFAKYLPVDGEIKEGDTFLDSELGVCIRLEEGSHYYTWVSYRGGKTSLRITDEHNKCKLFLCSTDIQGGDKVTLTGDPKAFDFADSFDAEAYKKKGFFKVIGEISHSASGEWVTRFTGYSNPNANHIDNYMPSCPSCNINKHGDSIEGFRRNIAGYLNSLNQRMVQYKMVKKYGLVEETNKPVVFFFEQIDKLKSA